MKRLMTVCLCAALLLSALAGCGDRGEPAASSSQPELSAPVSSEAEEPAESSEPDDSDQVSTAAVRRELFQYQQNGKNYAVAYPAFLGVRHAEALNSAVKACATQDANENGYTEEKDAAGKTIEVTIRTDYELKRQSGDFISVVFTTSFGRSDAAHPSKYARSVNFDLHSGKQMETADLLKDDDDLYEVVWEAVRDNAPEDIRNALPTETIVQNKAEISVYMTPDGIGFALPVPYALGDVYQIVVPYWEMKPYLKVDADPQLNARYIPPQEDGEGSAPD